MGLFSRPTMDTISIKRRSWNMSRIRSKNTSPELKVRKILFDLGFRYRLHVNTLPGKPDIYFPGKKTAIFLDGCFWHKCKICYTAPLANSSFWRDKINRNKKRDKEVNRKLKKIGINVVRIWEHDIRRKNFSLNSLV